MKQWKVLLALFFTFCYLPLALAKAPITGIWTTIDDVSGKKRALVELRVSGDILTGTIIKIYSQAGDTGICSKCPGAFKNKPIQGLQFVWDLKRKSDDQWTDGHILDPKTGKVYRAKMTLNKNGTELQVRAYVGLSIFGRSQTWVR